MSNRAELKNEQRKILTFNFFALLIALRGRSTLSTLRIFTTFLDPGELEVSELYKENEKIIINT